MMFLYRGPRRSLEDDLLIAHIGLLGNPTITSYTIDKDNNIVYAPANPFRHMAQCIDTFKAAAEIAGEAIKSFGAHIAKQVVTK